MWRVQFPSAIIKRYSSSALRSRGSFAVIPQEFTYFQQPAGVSGGKIGNSALSALEFHSTPRNLAENQQSDDDDDIPTMNTEQLKQLVETKPDSFTFIDVRSDEEIFETGPFFKGANQIPVEEVPHAFEELDDDDFFNEYGFDKPSKDDHIVFSCRAGSRSQTASKIAKQNGYKNVTNYVDGAAGWFNLPS